MSIPIAEEYIDFMDLESGFKLTSPEIKMYARRMKDFAKIHVEAALKAAGEKAIEIQTPDKRKYVSKKAIIASYSLDNIK
jgi:hypothetical protein